MTEHEKKKKHVRTTVHTTRQARLGLTSESIQKHLLSESELGFRRVIELTIATETAEKTLGSEGIREDPRSTR